MCRTMLLHQVVRSLETVKQKQFVKFTGSLATALTVAQIKVWYNRFKDGSTSVEKNERSRRPSTCRNDVIIEEVKTLIMA